MGGPGSGNFRRRSGYLEGCIAIRLPELRRLGLIQADHVRSRSITLAQLSGDIVPAWVQVDANLERASWPLVRLHEGGELDGYRMKLKAVPQPRGGHRWFALSPS